MDEMTVGDSSTADIPSDLINPEHMTFHNAPHPDNREPIPIQITTWNDTHAMLVTITQTFSTTQIFSE